MSARKCLMTGGALISITMVFASCSSCIGDERDSVADSGLDSADERAADVTPRALVPLMPYARSAARTPPDDENDDRHQGHSDGRPSVSFVAAL
jgi:hypothetical protein